MLWCGRRGMGGRARFVLNWRESGKFGLCSFFQKKKKKQLWLALFIHSTDIMLRLLQDGIKGHALLKGLIRILRMGDPF